MTTAVTPSTLPRLTIESPKVVMFKWIKSLLQRRKLKKLALAAEKAASDLVETLLIKATTQQLQDFLSEKITGFQLMEPINYDLAHDLPNRFSVEQLHQIVQRAANQRARLA